MADAVFTQQLQEHLYTLTQIDIMDTREVCLELLIRKLSICGLQIIRPDQLI